MKQNICIIAGESSGDMHAAFLIREMKLLKPEIEFFGIGGDQMADEGVELLEHINNVNYMGFIEVLKHIPRINRLMNLLLKEIRRRHASLVIPVDYPGFNLRLIEKLKLHQQNQSISNGTPTVFYYISPQVWAWGAKRIPRLAKAVDRMAGILPFEEDFYRGSGIDFHFVGHPLLDEMRSFTPKEDFYTKYEIPQNKTLIALLPGSRIQEIRRILPVMLEARSIINQSIEATFALGAATTVDKSSYGNISGITIVQGDTRSLMKNADLVITKSGTATLETALAGTPMVVVYRLNQLSYLIGKHVVKIKDIALVNVVAGKRIVPELIQHQAIAQNIADEALNILQNESVRCKMLENLRIVGEKLGGTGASRRAAELALELIEHKKNN